MIAFERDAHANCIKLLKLIKNGINSTEWWQCDNESNAKFDFNLNFVIAK